jgi:hypothetical protein
MTIEKSSRLCWTKHVDDWLIPGRRGGRLAQVEFSSKWRVTSSGSNFAANPIHERMA